MHFFAAFKITPQDIVKLTRPRDDFKSGEKRREKQKNKFSENVSYFFSNFVRKQEDVMAAITSKKLLFEATLLQQQLAQAEQNISNLPIAKQLPAINEVAEIEQKKFQELQQKVESFFSKTDLFDMDDSAQISQKLSEGLSHLKNISETQEKLLIYSEIYSNAQEALKSTQSDRSEKLRSVALCIIKTMGQNSFNPGITLALVDLQKNLNQAILGQREEALKTPLQGFSISQNSDLLAKQFADEHHLLMQQKGSYQEIHERFLLFFEKLRIASNNNSSLKANGTFFRVYDTVFNLLGNLQILQAKIDKGLSNQMAAAFKAVITTTANSQQAIPISAKQEEKKTTYLQASIEELLRAFVFLKAGTPDAVEQASGILKALYQKKSTWIFAMNDTQPMLIVSRVFFHLYHIHRVENPSLLRNDADYGFKAFIAFNGFTATNSERIRALQRTVVELALSGLEEGVNAEDTASISLLLKVLEEFNSPNEVNIAHALFGSLHRLHTESRKSNSTLIDPNQPRFNGDFGRNAFPVFINGLEKTTKLQSIAAVRDSLKSAWQI
jgi:hypothetical protein